jgi:drug/metabolite transporter (DMT)-like permease
MIGQKNLRPTIVGMYNYLQPIMASIVGVWLGLDNFTPIKIVGVILIFGGVFMVTWSSHHKDIQH